MGGGRRILIRGCNDFGFGVVLVPESRRCSFNAHVASLTRRRAKAIGSSQLLDGTWKCASMRVRGDGVLYVSRQMLRTEYIHTPHCTYVHRASYL